jgi:hypothetical protein
MPTTAKANTATITVNRRLSKPLYIMGTFIEKNAKPSNSGCIIKRAEAAILCTSAKITENRIYHIHASILYSDNLVIIADNRLVPLETQRSITGW